MPENRIIRSEFVQGDSYGKIRIEVWYYEYAGGGTGYTYALWGPRRREFLSRNEYGGPTAALIDGYLHALTGYPDATDGVPA